MKLKSLRLSLPNVARTMNSKTMEAVAAGITKKRDSDGKFTEITDYAFVDCAACHGDTLRVKFPAELAEKVENLREQLENDVIINISFTKLKLIPYALKASDGSVLSGVSAKADDFKIESTTLDELDDIIVD